MISNVATSGLNGGFNSQSEFTDPSDLGADSSFEPSYTQLKMSSDKGTKRQKRSDSFELGGMFEFDRSHELEQELEEATFEKISQPRGGE